MCSSETLPQLWSPSLRLGNKCRDTKVRIHCQEKLLQPPKSHTGDQIAPVHLFSLPTKLTTEQHCVKGRVSVEVLRDLESVFLFIGFPLLLPVFSFFIMVKNIYIYHIKFDILTICKCTFHGINYTHTIQPSLLFPELFHHSKKEALSPQSLW